MLIKEYSYPNNIIRGRSVICWIMNCWFSIRTKRRLYVPKRKNRYKNQEGKCTGNSEHNPLPLTHSIGYSFCVLLTIADLVEAPFYGYNILKSNERLFCI